MAGMDAGYASREGGGAGTYFEYPRTLGSEGGPDLHWMNFEARDFKSDNLMWSCALYIPPDALNTSFKSGWEGSKLGTLGGVAADAAMMITRPGMTGGAQPGQGAPHQKGTSEIVADVVAAMKKAKGSEKSAQVVGQAAMLKLAANPLMPEGTKTIMERSLGAVLNPYIVASYKGPEDLRTHDFSFKMMPQDSDESHNCLHISRLFKAAMLPSHGGAGDASAPSMVFGYPDHFDIKFFINGDPLAAQNSLFKIGRSVLTSCDLSYTTQDVPLFFEGTQYPVTIDMKLTFMEVEVMYREKVIKEGY